jgi:hypothetical protein
MNETYQRKPNMYEQTPKNSTKDDMDMKHCTTYLRVGREEGELQRPAVLDAA